MSLSEVQRSKIRGDLEDISDDLSITFLDERQKIENLTDFPLAQVTFNSEGRRQRYWRALLHDYSDPYYNYTTHYGNISQATISVSIRDTDLDNLQLKAYEYNLALWKQAYNWTLENESKIEFAGSDPPKFLPPYLALDERTNIYSCNIDFFVDYEFSYTVDSYPITNIVANTGIGVLASRTMSENENVADLDELYYPGPGIYLMNGAITGNHSEYSCGGELE